MKTEQEQIEEMIKIFTDNREVCQHMRCVECKYHGDVECMYSSCANSLYQAGYGDVSEYKAEIERLKNENEKLRNERGYINQLKEELLLKRYNVDCYQEEIVKQAQIDVLNRLKARHDYAMKNMGYPWDIQQQIDELIKEVQNGENVDDKGKG